MSNYINNNTWNDAAAYGAGLGHTLGQAMIGMPQQRAQLAMQLAQQQQEQQRYQQNQALAAWQMDAMDKYRTREADLQQLGINQRKEQSVAQRAQEKANADRDFQLRQAIAAMPRQSGGYLLPGAQVGQGLPQQGVVGQDTVLAPGAQGLPQQGLSSGLPLGVTALPKTGVSSTYTPHQQNMDTTATLENYLGVLSNPAIQKLDPKILPRLSNEVYGATSPIRQGLPTGTNRWTRIK